MYNVFPAAKRLKRELVSGLDQSASTSACHLDGNDDWWTKRCHKPLRKQWKMIRFFHVWGVGARPLPLEYRHLVSNSCSFRRWLHVDESEFWTVRGISAKRGLGSGLLVISDVNNNDITFSSDANTGQPMEPLMTILVHCNNKSKRIHGRHCLRLRPFIYTWKTVSFLCYSAFPDLRSNSWWSRHLLDPLNSEWSRKWSVD